MLGASRTRARASCTAAPPTSRSPCCARAGADAISLDAALLTAAHYDALGEAIDAGCGLWLGVLPGTDAGVTLDRARAPIERLWRELGFPLDELAAAVVPTPACGLAGASPAYVRRALALLRDTGHWLVDAGH